MKVLFAVSNEEISESIVKKYQKEYKQIISYKNVYYFNAILKELQKDKTYDRVVISEDLEAFTHTQYDQIDKFIFDKLDNISDEASNTRGNDIPIILICSDRRTKSEEMLVKLFGIGVYNAIIGSDRSVDEVCNLIYRPRSKKDAKSYYKIDVENVNYQSENENDVSEMEIQNILAHYKRLGKNEDRYIDSFNNIAAQYNDTQLRIISKFLPLNVRAVLEEKSQKYQQIMSFNNSVSDKLRRPKKEEPEGPSQKLLIPKTKDRIMSKPVVIPSSVNMKDAKKLSRMQPKKESQDVNSSSLQQTQRQAPMQMQIPDIDEEVTTHSIQSLQRQEPIQNQSSEIYNELNSFETQEQQSEPVKKGRGRPRKNPLPSTEEQVSKVKRGRGRPRKNPVIEDTNSSILPLEEENDNVSMLQGFEENSMDSSPSSTYIRGENTILPGFDNDNIQDEETTLPGFEDYDSKNDTETILPGFDTLSDNENNEDIFNSRYEQQNNITNQASVRYNSDFETNQMEGESVYNTNDTYNNNLEVETDEKEYVDLSGLLTPDRKIVTFVGTSKNGTSFIVNNLAEILSMGGVNTAILDTTKNRNAYYIYTKNEEELRQIATRSIDGLARGVANGIEVNKNLTVYTSLPEEGKGIKNVNRVLESLLKKHSLILIDTDFETPIGYFEQSQETYLVQTLDVLTIQPLTAFLRELKAKNVLDDKKLKIILNKTVKIKGITDKTIIGGMAYYNDPAMSFMTELFDRNTIRYVSIPFEETVYAKYLENIIECNISLKGYSKTFMQTLKELSNMVYSLTNTYTPPTANGGYGRSAFTPNMNNTLNQMKNNY